MEEIYSYFDYYLCEYRPIAWLQLKKISADACSNTIIIDLSMKKIIGSQFLFGKKATKVFI